MQVGECGSSEPPRRDRCVPAHEALNCRGGDAVRGFIGCGASGWNAEFVIAEMATIEASP
jgi:hypothetical protein